MADCFDIYMFPAAEGDCFWIRYGSAGVFHNILIDGGRESTADLIKEFILQLPEQERRLELLVVSHIDRDHIEGILKLAGDEALCLETEDIWFNAYHHLQDEIMGAVMGEKLSDSIIAREWPWNKGFGGYTSAVKLADDGGNRDLSLAGGMHVILLSPDSAKLLKLVPRWEKECQKVGLLPGLEVEVRPPVPADYEEMGLIDIDELADSPFARDNSVPNGTSIAFLLEYGGKRALFAADAHPDLLLKNLQGMTAESSGKLQLDVFKVPHHGSKNNTSKELLDCIDCPTYLLSTNGSQFHHPDSAAVARILKYGGMEKVLVFNYRSNENEVWESQEWQEQYGYRTRYPEIGRESTIKLSLLPED